ncbi:hypothetical protein [Methylocystis sp. JR02]|uniref:hypothetical protein n=1 Tax=Methylocystis sp. JR02 TaxID=3046284 RepID=UPI0024B8A82B|nr:hypothetical protein [Methylocystis sp. JR02]MDJ0450752.1 hypothetical protein [Methylocystis sp. JR02]
MDIDDGSARRDIIVVADVPLRDVDEVMVGEAARRIRHAGEAEIRAIGEDGGQQRRPVGGRGAGAQMRETIGKLCPAVDITQNLGDPRPRQHPVQSNGENARGVRDGRLDPGDVELAVFDLDAVEFAARSAGSQKFRRSFKAAARLAT